MNPFARERAHGYTAAMPPTFEQSFSTPSLPLEFTVPAGESGARLDAVLGAALPGLGLRGRRRLWDWCRVLVNGRARPPGHAVSAGDLVRLEAQTPALSSPLEADASSLDLVVLHEDLAALAKPAGLHTARIAGSPGRSLEERLEAAWPGIREGLPRAAARNALHVPRLLTRLDRETSGLVLAALTQEAEACFRDLERLGRVEKTYHALVRGRLDTELLLRNRLLTGNRAVTTVLEDPDPDPVRHTLVRPSSAPEGQSNGARTLVEAVIRRGARHQIRAHLAHAGFPIAGDRVYGIVEGNAGEDDRLFLHHGRVVLPGFYAELPAAWLPR